MISQCFQILCSESFCFQADYLVTIVFNFLNTWLQLVEPDMEAEHGLISSLLEWAGRRVDGARTAEAVAEWLGGAQLPSVPFTSGSSQGDMDVSLFIFV